MKKTKASSSKTLAKKLKVPKKRAQKAINAAKLLDETKRKKKIRKAFDMVHSKFSKTLKNLAK